MDSFIYSTGARGCHSVNVCACIYIGSLFINACRSSGNRYGDDLNAYIAAPAPPSISFPPLTRMQSSHRDVGPPETGRERGRAPEAVEDEGRPSESERYRWRPEKTPKSRSKTGGDGGRPSESEPQSGRRKKSVQGRQRRGVDGQSPSDTDRDGGRAPKAVRYGVRPGETGEDHPSIQFLFLFHPNFREPSILTKPDEKKNKQTNETKQNKKKTDNNQKENEKERKRERITISLLV